MMLVPLFRESCCRSPRGRRQQQRTFTGPLARSVALVAIVVGLTFMFGEMDVKRQLAGIVFGGDWR